jgi:hypothetical protein
MADDSQIPNLDGLVDGLVEALYDPAKLTRLQNALRNAASESATISQALPYSALDWTLGKFGSFLLWVEEHLEEIAGPPLAGIVGHLLGNEVSVNELRQSAAAGGDPRIGRLVAKLALQTLSDEGTELQPGTAAAERFLTLVSQLVVNGWFEGTAFALLAEEFPAAEALESLAELPRELVDALGLGRLARVALRPLAQTLIATPLTWDLNKRHTPSLLPESTAIEEYLSGNFTEGQLHEELARQGWSPERIDSLVRNRTKQLSLEELQTLRRHGEIEYADVIDTLRESGWLDVTARLRVSAADHQRLDEIQDNANATLLRAFIDGDLSAAELRTLLATRFADPLNLDAWVATAQLQKENTRTHLSQAEVIACVKKNIVPVAYYRDWLAREHYAEPEAFALELLLRSEIDAATSIEDHRKQVEAERAAEKAAAAKDKADRLAKAEAERALVRRGPLSELRQAAVRGLIPFARVEEVLTAQYDPDFVQIFMDLVEGDRVAYQKQQAAAAEAEKRAANRHIEIGALEQAVLTNVLDLGRFRQALRDRGIADDDADLLTATLAARKQDQDDAKRKRAAAEAAAKVKHIDLSKFESLVRRGARSLADYDTLLEQLGFDDPSRAAMGELLQLQIADDTKARKAREDAAAKLQQKGVSLETARRAVVLGLTTVDAYEHFLMAQGFTSDAVALMIADVQHDIADAAAAAQRRAEADAAKQQPAIPLADVRRAARLGTIDVAVYQDRLAAAGYSADDIEIELTLLTAEIADVQAARQKQQQADKTVTHGLSLTQLAAAVRAGVKHLEDYRAAAAANPNLSKDDVDTLVRVLADELASSNVARARRAALASAVQPKDVSIGALEQQVRAGTLSIQAYVRALEEAGLDDVDIDLLSTLVVDELTASTGL